MIEESSVTATLVLLKGSELTKFYTKNFLTPLNYLSIYGFLFVIIILIKFKVTLKQCHKHLLLHEVNIVQSSY